MNINDYKEQFNKVINHLKVELGSIKTGRATPALIENLDVEAYGTKMPLKGVASINVQDPQTLYVEPWDKSLIKNIEKAISSSNLSLNPVSDGRGLRVAFPKLTEERRKEIVKIVKDKLEEARIGIRIERDEVKSEIVSLEESGEISEDEKYRLIEDLDKMTGEFNDLIKKIGEEKEKEIMTI